MTSTAGDPELELMVHDRLTIARDVVALELRAPDGGLLPDWAPGAHIDLLLTDDLTRQYSLCGDPAVENSWRIAVLREPNGRGGSAFVHDSLRPGDPVRVRGPRNNFSLHPARRYIFVAGGVGITPILPMLAATDRAGADWRLTYGGRSRTSMAFADDLKAAYGDHVDLCPEDEQGLLDLDALLAEPTEDTLVYCCGPEGLLAAVEKYSYHWQPATLHVERFTPKDQDAPTRSDAFEVELAATGTTLMVPPDRTVLEIIEDAGVPVASSCREGLCGTCETAVLAGEVDHRDSMLSDEERAAHDTMFICVSRAASSKLILDL